MVTRAEYAQVIQKALEVKNNTPLSQAALEVLAIIAYNQPVTKSFIEQVRGVDSGSVVNSLVAKGLVEEQGRLEIPGRPISYGTTEHFLRCFGMKTSKLCQSCRSKLRCSRKNRQSNSLQRRKGRWQR